MKKSPLEKILKYSLSSTLSLSGCGAFVPGTTLPDGGDTLYELACYESQPEDDLDCDNILNHDDPCPFDYNNDCGNTIPGGGLFSPPGNKEACYYMGSNNYNAAVSLFTEIAQYYPKDLWLEFNGHPCDNPSDLPTDVPKSDCIKCTDKIFDEAGW
jgi:hypothetical protein